MKSNSVIIVSALAALVSAASCSSTNTGSASHIYSENVKDSFELYIDLPEGYRTDTGYSIVFYLDANLKMGKEIRKQIRLKPNKERLSKVIFVGVGHIGNYRKQRRRDFIPPVMKEGQTLPSTDPEYGQAEKFYRFLSGELIPLMNESYPNNGAYSLIGHSFSGLFAFYCLFKEEPVFQNHIAMSPSLWVNSDNIFHYEKAFYTSGQRTLRAKLYHSCGTGEWANRVLGSSRKMNALLHARKYEGLEYIYSEHKGKNHNGTVAVSLEYVFTGMRL